jgi:hypothetical protein
LARNLASPCFGHKPKAKVATIIAETNEGKIIVTTFVEVLEVGESMSSHKNDVVMIVNHTHITMFGSLNF